MKAAEITDSILQTIAEGKTDFIRLNYANGDMVGHTGVFPAIVKAVETVDQCLKYLSSHLAEKGYNVVALDAPAHGYSGSEIFNAILYSEFINVAAKKFNPDIIVGHSVGGMAAVFYQHKYKNLNLDKLVLLGAPSNFAGVFKRYVKMMGYNNIIDKQIGKIVYNKYGHLPDYFSAAEFTKSINTSGLIIHDERDRVIPYQDAINFEQKYKNAQLIRTEGLGHSLNSETVFEYINTFIA